MAAENQLAFIASPYVFRQFIKPRLHGGGRTLDASAILSAECYHAWLRAVRLQESHGGAAHLFVQALGEHLSGSNGKRPFHADEEAAILEYVRSSQALRPLHGALTPIRQGQGYHEKISPTGNTRALLHHPPTKPAAAAILRPVDADTATANVNRMLHQLNADDAAFLTNMGGEIVSNFAATFTPEDRQTIEEILRFTILGRTKRCCKDTQKYVAFAPALCAKFAGAAAANTLVTVFDITGKTAHDRVLAQNELSKSMFGGTTTTYTSPLCHVHRSDLFRSILAIGGAFHRPGVCFTIHQQVIVRGDDRDQRAPAVAADLNYYVDPESLFLVVYGRLLA